MHARAVLTATVVLCLLLPQSLIAVDPPNPPRPRAYFGDGRDLDGPSGNPVFLTSRPDRLEKTPAATIAFYDFEGGTGHDPQGWISIDRGQDPGWMFHVDAADFAGGNLDGGTFGRLNVISGNKSLWCGAPPGFTADVCSYPARPGYGNDWHQVIESDPITLTPGIGLVVDFKVRFDVEPDYDFIYFEFINDVGEWEPMLLASAGEFFYTGRSTDIVPGGIVNENYAIPGFDLPPDETRLRFRFVSDGGGSDQDGLFNSDGALIVDDIEIRDGFSNLLDSEDFESAAIGATSAGIWHARTIGLGNFAKLYPGTSLLQQSPPLAPMDVLSTCVWAFTDGSPDDYACGGFPGTPVIPFGSPDTGYMNNDIRSPWILWEPAPGQTTHLEFDAYMDMGAGYNTFIRVLARQRSDGGCPTRWRSTGFYYYYTLSRQSYAFDVSSLFTSTAGVDEIQFAINVVDAAPVFGAATCHSNAPIFDNVSVSLDNTHSWVVNDLDLFQDAFPSDGSGTGKIRVDAACGSDEARFTVTEPGVGLDVENNSAAVFCHVKTLPGKAGAIVSGGQQWPEVPSMSDVDWTVLQCSPTGVLHEYSIDLNDDLYEAGDVVWFYFSVRDANAVTTYFSQFTGRVDTEAEARAYPMEFTGLPTGQSEILYVDAFSSRGAEPFFNTAFAEIGIQPDRYDVRGPTSFCENHLGDAVSNVTNQLVPYYTTIIYNSGDLEAGTIKSGDFGALLTFVENHPGPVIGIYLSGDHLASEWNASQDQNAVSFRQYCDFSVVESDHRNAGEPNSPTVIPVGGSPFATKMVAYGGGSVPGRFDVLSAGLNSAVGLEYNPTNTPALVYQSSATPGNGVVNVVLSGYSYHVIRDDEPDGIADRTIHLSEILEYASGNGGTPSGVTPSTWNRLDQNVPNPFNPNTTIAYSIQERGHVTLAVYDVTGRLVRTLVSDVQSPGGYSVVWDGRSDAGAAVATGVYFYKLDAKGFKQTRKMALLK